LAQFNVMGQDKIDLDLITQNVVKFPGLTTQSKARICVKILTLTIRQITPHRGRIATCRPKILGKIGGNGDSHGGDGVGHLRHSVDCP
jgi:hypothetical protein